MAPQRDGVGDVLRHDRVEELAAHRQAPGEDPEQDLTRAPQPAVHVPGAVQVRVIDQPLPARRRPRLLEVDPHDHKQVFLERRRPLTEPGGIVERRLDVVHAARPDDHEQAVVLAVEHAVHPQAPAQHHFGLGLGQGQLFEQLVGRDERLDPLDPLVADRVRRAEGRQRHLVSYAATRSRLPVSRLPASSAAASTRST